MLVVESCGGVSFLYSQEQIMVLKFTDPRVLLAVVMASALSTVTAAQSYKVESTATPAPQGLAAGIRDTLSASALHVTGPNGALCEIWLRKSVPQAATPNTSLGVAFGQINEGTLVGAIQLDARATDYRNQSIQPGVYTLRYMLLPVDGNHQGVSPNRDYLLLVPAALDASPADVITKDLLALSRKAAGTGHPSVWSLVPADTAPSSLPAVVHQDDGDLWIVFFQAPLGTSTTMGLVVAGHAAEP
jgi:hypothetical protein